MDLGLKQRTLPVDGVLTLGADEAHVWLARIGQPSQCGATDFAILSACEQERARSMAAAPAKQFVSARALLRRLLAAYLPNSPAGIEIAYGPHGKPFLVGTASQAGIHFNLSHTADIASIAIGRAPLGIDIESLRDLSHSEALAARLFAPSEVRALGRAPASQQRRTFFAYWTCKEACVKARGGGIAQGMASIEVEINAQGEAALLGSDGMHDPGWTLRQLPLGENLAGAVAINRRDCSLRCWCLDSSQESRPGSKP